MFLPGGGIEEGDRVIIDYVPRPVPGMRVEAIDRLPRPARQPASGPAAGTPQRR